MNHTFSRRIAAFACAMGGTLFSFSTHAQSPAEQLVRLGGSMQAVAQECGDNDEQLRQSKEQQRTMIADMGMSSEQFDKLFKAAYEETHAKIAAGTPAQKAEMCEQMKTTWSQTK